MAEPTQHLYHLNFLVRLVQSNFFKKSSLNQIIDIKIKKSLVLLTAITLMLLQACSSDEGVGPSEEEGRWRSLETFKIEWRINDLEMTNLFSAKGQPKGESTMAEASGLAPSISNPGFLWSHNDKGNENLLFLLDKKTGQTVARYRLQGINNRDWEDMEITAGSDANYIFLGDIGDNNRVYPNYVIHRFVEPVFDEAHRGMVIDWTPEDHLEYRYIYPEGKKHDSETLLYDPVFDDLYVVTKRDFNSIIYALPGDLDWTQTQEARYIGEFRFTRAVGGNVSIDGSQVLVKTYDFIMYWKRDLEKPLWKTLQSQPMLAPYNPVEPQGEAISFDLEGRAYYTLSEYSNSITPVLYKYIKN